MGTGPTSTGSRQVAIAIWAAAIAVAGNAAVAVINGYNDRELERLKLQNQQLLDSGKAESERILAMIRTDNPDAAAANLRFLLETALIDDVDTAAGLIEYLRTRRAGEGISLPTTAGGNAVRRTTPADGNERPAGPDRLSQSEVEEFLKRYGLRPGEPRRPLTIKYIQQRNMK